MDDQPSRSSTVITPHTVAIVGEPSPVAAGAGDVFTSLSNGLAEDDSNSSVGVPENDNYGDLPLVIGFDSEWQQQGDSNLMLSYQYHALCGERSWNGIAIVAGRRRLTLRKFVTSAILEGLRQGFLEQWPKKLYLIGHFTAADFPAFTDFSRHKHSVDAIRRTYVSLGKPLRIKLWDLQRHEHCVEVIVRDTMLLAPGGKQKLEDLGHIVKLEKLDLTPDQKSNMTKLLQDDPEKFVRYALRDPEICCRYSYMLLRISRKLTGKNEIPVTLSSTGIDFLFRTWSKKGIDRQRVLGTETVVEEGWSKHRGRKFKTQRDVPLVLRNAYENLAIECFHGGRGEQYGFGAFPEGIWSDYDLAGAYSTAMALIPMPDWENLRQSRDLDEYQPDTLGYAYVKFRFPDTVRFPCLPVRSQHGLIFPLEGETACCAPEIYLARKLGAEVQIKLGIILPAQFVIRPFEEYILQCTALRKSCQKGTLEELLFKELVNATYGKCAQGLRPKRCFDSRTGRYATMPPSRITNPYIAAHVTSLVRAVLGEIMESLPKDVLVCSATTDGFLSTASAEDIALATRGPLCQIFAAARMRISGDPIILEVKHRIAQPLGWRTRGQATLLPLPNEKLVLAKAGLKPPRLMNKADQNDFIVQQFLERSANSTLPVPRLRSLPDVWRNQGDFTQAEVIKKVVMEYDWKRRPVAPCMRNIREVDHLYFDTRPWRTVNEFIHCRENWEAFRGHSAICLKTMEDLDDFAQFIATDLSGTKLRKHRRASAVDLAKRMFLRAYTRCLCGLNQSELSYGELAAWLTSNGYSTKKSDVENANRRNASFVTHVVPRIPAVAKFLAKIKERFPDFDAETLLHREIDPQKKL